MLNADTALDKLNDNVMHKDGHAELATTSS